MRVTMSKKGVFAWKDKNAGVSGSVVGDVYVEIPDTETELHEAVESYSTTFTDENGETVRLKGAHGLLARKYYDGYESVRGEARSRHVDTGREPTLEEIQIIADGTKPYTGKSGGFKRPEVKEDELEGLTAAEVIALMKQRGVKIS